MSGTDFRRHLPDGRTRLLGILGQPLGHSLSPALHTGVLRRLDRNLLYVPVPVSAERLGAFLRLAGEMGFVGCNVTTPFKEAVLRWTKPADTETRRTGMANTLTFAALGRPTSRGPRVPAAMGTDGRGILSWLERVACAGRPFGVLGFGATARSLVHAAWAAGSPPDVIVTQRPGPVRRTLARWAAATERPRLRANPPLVLGDLGSVPGRIPVWVSTWPPAVLPAESFWTALPRGAVLLDMNYGPGRATLAEVARDRSVRAADGLGPLLEQAALSLSAWLGEPVSSDHFRKVLGEPAGRLRPRR